MSAILARMCHITLDGLDQDYICSDLSLLQFDRQSRVLARVAPVANFNLHRLI